MKAPNQVLLGINPPVVLAELNPRKKLPNGGMFTARRKLAGPDVSVPCVDDAHINTHGETACPQRT